MPFDTCLDALRSMMLDATQSRKAVRLSYASAWIPPWRFEAAFYFATFYSLMAGFLGILVPLVWTGIMVVLVAFCVTRLGSSFKKVLAPIGLLLAFAISFLLVQIVVHGASVMDDALRNIINWVLGLIVVQTLGLRRGFSHRYIVLLLVLGLIALPYLTFMVSGDVEQARVDADLGIQGGLAHPGGLAGWFGFCAVYFAILGLENNRVVVRVIIWLVAVGCMFIVGLTVERGPLLGMAIAITIGFRGILRRGFAPLLGVIILAGVFSESGLFDRVVSQYQERGMEDTGRETIWLAGIERIFDAPIVGVGASNVAISPGGTMGTRALAPHNSFLEIALGSGVLPFTFYLGFWIAAFRRSFSRVARPVNSQFQLPFLLYMFVTMMLGDLNTSPWSLLAIAVGAGVGVSSQTARVLIRHNDKEPRMARPPGRGSHVVRQQL